MNFFSLVLIAYILFILVSRSSISQKYISLFLATAFIQLSIEVGYFFKIGSFDLNYGNFMLLFTSFFGLIVLLKNNPKIDTKNLICILLFFISLLMGILRILIFPTNIPGANINVNWDEKLSLGMIFENLHFTSFSLQIFIYFVLYIINIVCINSLNDKYSFTNFIDRFSKYIKFYLIISVSEVIIKNIFHSDIYNQLLTIIFGQSESTLTALLTRGNGYALQGLTKEASHYAFTILVFQIIFLDIFLKNKSKINFSYLLLITFLSLFSMSFSSFLFELFFLVIIFLYLLNKNKNVRLIYFFIFLIIVPVILFFIIKFSLDNYVYLPEDTFWGRRFKSLVEEIQLITSGNWRFVNQSLEWSNRTRLLSNYEGLKLFIKRPFFGFGVGNVTAHGSTTMFLAGGGFVSFLMWCKLTYFYKKNIGNSYYIIIITLWSAINILNSLSFGPYIGLYMVLTVQCWINLLKMNRL